MENVYDTIVIGSGPAGLTAAIYAGRREMKTLVIGQLLGGQLVWASEIENYPGFKSITAHELTQKMQEQVLSIGIEIKTAEIKKIEKAENDEYVITNGKDTYRAKTIIIAIGLVPRRLAVKGEEELTGRGVSYCANCDGPFFKNKTVAVIGGGNAALDAADVMSKIAAKVYLIHRLKTCEGFEILFHEIKNRPNVELLLDSQVQEIVGANKVEELVVSNNETNAKQNIKIDGVFIEVGRIAHTDLVADLLERDERNQIIVDAKACTSAPGIFAAGDVTNVPFKQITIACGQGTIAALSAYEYLQKKQASQPK